MAPVARAARRREGLAQCGAHGDDALGHLAALGAPLRLELGVPQHLVRVRVRVRVRGRVRGRVRVRVRGRGRGRV